MSKRKRRRGRANHLFLGSKAQYNVSGSLDQSFISDEHLLELEQHLYPPPRVNPNTTYELWLITMCQYRFTLGQECPLLLSDADSVLGQET